MIGIQLSGRLGNQMFEYATARSLANRLNCPLIIAGHTTGRRYGVAGHYLKGIPVLRKHLSKSDVFQWNGILHSAFGRGPKILSGRLTEVAMPWLRRTLLPRTFVPAQFSIGERLYETYDSRFSEVRPGTWLQGWFQSERYFASSREHVRDWFSPRPLQQEKLSEIMARWPGAPTEMVAIHIRRGDYADVRGGVSHQRDGWLLPSRYYREALEHVPRTAQVAVFSDDPEWAERELADRRPWVSRGNDAVLDMLLIANCKWNIISNSSFSWWSGWLNRLPNKSVIAPKFHLGWRVGRWVPDGIQVDGWQYIEPGE